MKTTVLTTPLFFGVAHLHHLYDKVAVQQVPIALALQQVRRTRIEQPSLLSQEPVVFSPITSSPAACISVQACVDSVMMSMTSWWPDADRSSMLGNMAVPHSQTSDLRTEPQ